MKKLILLFLIPFTMVMADFTLTGQTLTPVNEDETTPVTTSSIPTATRIYATTGSAKTNWGFQPFTVPSDSVTVPVGGDIQAAIDSLPNGGTINLEAGLYRVQRLDFNSNTVLQGAGKDKTKLKVIDGGTWAMYTSGGHKKDGIKNLIMRDFELDGNRQGGATRGGMIFAYGVSNILCENIYLHDIYRNGININNSTNSQMGKHYTFRNITARDIGWQPISLDHLIGVIIDNVNIVNAGMAFDFSSVIYGEVSNVQADLQKFTGYGDTFAERGGGSINGAKVQGSNYIYVHDTTIKRAILTGIKIVEGGDPHGKIHMHTENVTIEDCGEGFIQMGDQTYSRAAQEFVVKNVKLVDNYWNADCWNNKWLPVAGCNNQDGMLYSNIRIKGIDNLHEYDDNIGITVASAGTILNRVAHHNTTPHVDAVGWSSWGNP